MLMILINKKSLEESSLSISSGDKKGQTLLFIVKKHLPPDSC